MSHTKQVYTHQIDEDDDYNNEELEELTPHQINEESLREFDQLSQEIDECLKNMKKYIHEEGLVIGRTLTYLDLYDYITESR